MSGFDRELCELAERLAMPQPVRSRILIELAADLEDLERSLRRRGASAEEARRRALATLLPRAEALAALERLHRPLYRRLVDRFSDPVRGRLERTLLVLFVAGLSALALAWLGRVELLADPSPFVWPLLALGFGAAGVAAWKGFELFVKKAHEPERRRRGLWILPAAAVAGLVIGFGGAAFDLYALAGRLETDLSRQGVELIRWLRRDAATLAIGLLVSSISGLLWLVIAAGVARVDAWEAELPIGAPKHERRREGAS